MKILGGVGGVRPDGTVIWNVGSFCRRFRALSPLFSQPGDANGAIFLDG